jgi:NAD(P)-dependent dehydrogenase (short-subunit alcohol dehydrogenase family)
VEAENVAGRLAGKIAVITGAASGMGLAMARLFVAEGAQVVVADRSGTQGEVAAALGAAATSVQVDVSDAAEVQNMIDTAVSTFGGLDVLVNNAGFGGAYAPLVDTDEAAFDRIVATNFKGVYLGMRSAIPVMIARGGGSIVNICSAASLVGMRNLAVYGGAKAAVVQMARTAALDYAEQGIRINNICPGVTCAALFLASDESAYVTGTSLPVDGGYVAGSRELPPGPASVGGAARAANSGIVDR